MKGLGEILYLPADEYGLISRQTIFDVTEASSAFPVAFQPKRLRYISGDSLGNPCRSDGMPCRIEEAIFADGGVFDNNPLDLAMGIYNGLNDKPSNPLFIYINPGELRAGLRAVRQEQAKMAEDLPGIAAWHPFA